jgi:competence ComEA-like helix-hairpin-helix protein
VRTGIIRAIVFLWLAIPVNLFAAAELEKLTNVRLVENPSNDGDSFVVQTGTRQLHVRLYFADCPESVATTDADAKRVREQARYFGIADAKKVFEFGREAKAFTKQSLAKPFTVYTSYADALGRSPGGRVYAFVITGDGNDLARLLVENGFARAYGTRRTGPDGAGAADIQRQLQDLESQAMLKRRGIWAATDPDVLVKLRTEQREEDRQLKDLRQESSGKQIQLSPVDLNTATTQELQAISGIGPVLAAKIIAGRPYKNVDDLLRVSGIGAKLLEKIRPFLVVNSSVKPAGAAK